MTKWADLEKLAGIMGGVLIGRTAPRGAAARAGLLEGDIVLSVNGVATADLAAYARARSSRQGAVRLEVYRDGRQLSFEINLYVGPPESSAVRSASQADNPGSRAAWQRTCCSNAFSN